MQGTWLGFVAVPPSHDPQLLKGVLSLLLLRVLAERESYGYQLVQRLREIGLSGILDGTVYPALTRLEREGRVSSRLVASPSGPARKYYRPTEAGYAALAQGIAHWRSLAEVVDPVLSRPVPTRPAPPSEDD
jgi:PadR family transcriptional regulator, regulatory protein PadR